MIRICTLVFFALICVQSQSQDWSGKKAAVVLTYDDALQVHLDHVVPLLDSLGLKGTFYVTANFPGFRARVNDWKAITRKGHELGNHAVFHPCTGGMPGRDWVRADYDLSKYTVQRMQEELRTMNLILNLMDEKPTRTFAYPCGDMLISGVPYLAGMEKDFVAARGVKSEMSALKAIDLANVNSYSVNGHTGEQMIEMVKQAQHTGSLLVFTFHGVGGEHSINVTRDAHRKLVKYLKDHEKEIWVPTFEELCVYVKGKQAK